MDYNFYNMFIISYAHHFKFLPKFRIFRFIFANFLFLLFIYIIDDLSFSSDIRVHLFYLYYIFIELFVRYFLHIISYFITLLFYFIPIISFSHAFILLFIIIHNIMLHVLFHILYFYFTEVQTPPRFHFHSSPASSSSSVSYPSSVPSFRTLSYRKTSINVKNSPKFVKKPLEICNRVKT